MRERDLVPYIVDEPDAHWGNPLDGVIRNAEIKYIHETQVENLLNLNFHSLLSMSKSEYISSLPKIQPQPTEFRGKFDYPIIVDPRINLANQLKLLNVDIDSDFGDLEKYKHLYSSQEPYVLWVNNGHEKIGQSVDEVLINLKPNERPLTIVEGLAMLREKDFVFKDTKSVIDMAGSAMKSPRGKKTPTIYEIPCNIRHKLFISSSFTSFSKPHIGTQTAGILK